MRTEYAEVLRESVQVDHGVGHVAMNRKGKSLQLFDISFFDIRNSAASVVSLNRFCLDSYVNIPVVS